MKRLFTTMLALVFVLSSVTLPSHAFSDMPENWSKPYLQKAIEHGLLKGHEGKIFPESSVTRAEMVTVLARAMKTKDKGDLSKFTDVAANNWFYGEFAKAMSMNFLQGTGETTLSPRMTLTREQAFTMVARLLKYVDLNKEKFEAFTDANLVSAWARDAVASLVNAGIVQGDQNRLKPKDSITRAELAAILDRIVGTYLSKPGVYEQDIKGTVVVNVPGVLLKNMTIDGDLIIADGVAESGMTLENVKILGRLVLRNRGIEKNGVVLVKGTSIEKLVVATPNGEIEVSKDEDSVVKQLNVMGASKLVLKGNFKGIDALQANMSIDAKEADFSDLKIRAENVTVLIKDKVAARKVKAIGKNAVVEDAGEYAFIDDALVPLGTVNKNNADSTGGTTASGSTTGGSTGGESSGGGTTGGSGQNSGGSNQGGSNQGGQTPPPAQEEALKITVVHQAKEKVHGVFSGLLTTTSNKEAGKENIVKHNMAQYATDGVYVRMFVKDSEGNTKKFSKVFESLKLHSSVNSDSFPDSWNDLAGGNGRKIADWMGEKKKGEVSGTDLPGSAYKTENGTAIFYGVIQKAEYGENGLSKARSLVVREGTIYTEYQAKFLEDVFGEYTVVFEVVQQGKEHNVLATREVKLFKDDKVTITSNPIKNESVTDGVFSGEFTLESSGENGAKIGKDNIVGKFASDGLYVKISLSKVEGSEKTEMVFGEVFKSFRLSSKEGDGDYGAWYDLTSGKGEGGTGRRKADWMGEATSGEVIGTDLPGSAYRGGKSIFYGMIQNKELREGGLPRVRSLIVEANKSVTSQFKVSFLDEVTGTYEVKIEVLQQGKEDQMIAKPIYVNLTKEIREKRSFEGAKEYTADHNYGFENTQNNGLFTYATDGIYLRMTLKKDGANVPFASVFGGMSVNSYSFTEGKRKLADWKAESHEDNVPGTNLPESAFKNKGTGTSIFYGLVQGKKFKSEDPKTNVKTLVVTAGSSISAHYNIQLKQDAEGELKLLFEVLQQGHESNGALFESEETINPLVTEYRFGK